ncbi:MAG TPA: hypothetical protein VI454_19950, partial [Verrucomicrobiae bacterium]
GAGATVTIVVQPMAATTLTDVAGVSATEADLNPADNTASVKTIALAAPILTQQMQGGNVVLSWPVAAGNYAVDSALSMTPPVVWQPVAMTPTVVSGRYVLTIPVNSAAPSCFYRLRQAP